MYGEYYGPESDFEESGFARLTPASLIGAAVELAARDEVLGRIVDRWGLPPFWARPEGFHSLLHIILEQQVSLASARATYEKLSVHLGGDVSPESFLSLNDSVLRDIGFSRQKTGYGRTLAQAIRAGELNLQALHGVEDDVVRRSLVTLPGIGPWTADIYLLMALRRPDVWPEGDLALAVAMQQLWGLPDRPSRDVQRERSSTWAPWRAVAARLLWHYYLSGRR
jgi:DNA-3-methyladenine glycosylase II